MQKLLPLAFLILFTSSVFAVPFNNTTKLTGCWHSQDKKGLFEEQWSKPLGNSMMGMSRLVVPNKPTDFFEFMTLEDNGKNITMYIRHFASGQRLLEQQPLVYRLVDQADNKLIFKNIGSDPVRYIVYQFINDNKLVVSLQSSLVEGSVKEKFEFSKQDRC